MFINNNTINKGLPGPPRTDKTFVFKMLGSPRIPPILVAETFVFKMLGSRFAQKGT